MHSVLLGKNVVKKRKTWKKFCLIVSYIGYMSKSLSLISALICTLIWGTTFIAQDTGMDKIGPFTFNGTRFFVGFLALIPFFLIIEKKNFKKIFNKNKKKPPEK